MGGARAGGAAVGASGGSGQRAACSRAATARRKTAIRLDGAAARQHTRVERARAESTHSVSSDQDTPPGRCLAWAWRALDWRERRSKRRGDELVLRPRDGPQRPERVQVQGKWNTKSHGQRSSPRRRRARGCALFGRLALDSGWETSATTITTRVFSAMSMAVRGSSVHLV